MINEAFGWCWILLGFLAGAVIGLLFHRPDWLGGYDSHPRRLVRLGHVALVALGMLNVLFAQTAPRLHLSTPLLGIASAGLIVGAVAMPLVCGLYAWRRSLHLLFVVPVTALLVSVALIAVGCLP